MDPTAPLGLSLLCLAVALGAALYSAGGHGGGSAYLALFALFGMPAAVMKPTALAMNVLVAGVAVVRFGRSGAVPWRLLVPLCAGSVPAALGGGFILLPERIYMPLLGATLLVAAARLWLPARLDALRPAPAWPWLVLLGSALGFLAGLTGIGGGIFLSPILILAAWQDPRGASGAAAVFIVVNSAFGLAGHLLRGAPLSTAFLPLAGAAVIGGLAGSWLGAARLEARTLRRIHALVLLVASAKLLARLLRGA
ncbi:MAG: sulfite exporter TauE/SafE family protein [Deltaproteobacteria bacterium]|nr:sulfite exporter TauE/SafE family protein [Deltaproteobacteria bacterium]